MDEERRRIRAYTREFKLSVVNWFREMEVIFRKLQENLTLTVDVYVNG